MISDDERRAVAARLRALPIDIYAAFKEWGRDGLFVDANIYDEADYSQIHNAVFGYFPAEHMNLGDYKELHERLADLIDPTCEWRPDGGILTPWRCSACGCERSAAPNYCPNCGVRVVGPNGE